MLVVFGGVVGDRTIAFDPVIDAHSSVIFNLFGQRIFNYFRLFSDCFRLFFARFSTDFGSFSSLDLLFARFFFD
jgi:hypothetical protein